MKKIFLVLCLLSSLAGFSQLTFAPSGGNKRASVSEQIGLTNVTITYDRPGVKGREGKIWGDLVHAGFIDQGFGSSKAAPWRAGANESTTITFSTPVKIEGKDLPAGKYGFFIAYDPNESTLIFSKNSTAWGSYFYDEKDDALRVKIKPQPLDKSVEWLRYEFIDQKDNSAKISLEWEKLSFPFQVEVDYVNAQLASFRKELETNTGFNWLPWNQAAQWCLQRNVNLEQALQWADTATSTNFGGDRSFAAWSTKAQLLEKMGKTAEADAIMKKTMAFASMNEIHQYGRMLIAQKKNKEALDIFKSNYQKNPDQYTTLMGLARGYSANADYQNALKYAKQALTVVPTGQKSALEGSIKKLEEGKDMN